MHDETGALHMTILHMIPGRIRLQLEKSADLSRLKGFPGIRNAVFNPRLQTLTLTYDPNAISEHDVLLRTAAAYVRDCPTPILHVRHAEEGRFHLSHSGLLSLAAILADALATATGAQAASVTRWLSLGTTMGAVVDHGYQELSERGSFDPEVMSLVYLFNAIGKPSTLGPSVLAWGLTFGRHLIPREPRESAYIVTHKHDRITLTPVALQSAYASRLLSRSMEALSHA